MTEKICPRFTLATTSPKWTILGTNLGHHTGMLVTNQLSYGMTEELLASC